MWARSKIPRHVNPVPRRRRELTGCDTRARSRLRLLLDGEKINETDEENGMYCSVGAAEDAPARSA